ncbi:MAG: ribonuclease H-like domain-containing protein, partial [Candidatus Eisenbacteria bacterium]|nr:ribonuclease H-like domain-containing protein [Candidatus Eisenbacteria bacterium]
MSRRMWPDPPDASELLAVPIEDLLRELPGAIWTSTPEYARLDHPLGIPAPRILEGDELFFDVETLGFHGRQLFLVGAVMRDGEDWTVRQLLARDYAEEEAIVAGFAEMARLRPFWVSFNGKAFDAPFLRNRAAFYRLTLP